MKPNKENLELLTTRLHILQTALSTLDSLKAEPYTSDLMCSRAAIALSGVIEDLEYEIAALESQRQRDLEQGVMYRW